MMERGVEQTNCADDCMTSHDQMRVRLILEVTFRVLKNEMACWPVLYVAIHSSIDTARAVQTLFRDALRHRYVPL